MPVGQIVIIFCLGLNRFQFMTIKVMKKSLSCIPSAARTADTVGKTVRVSPAISYSYTFGELSSYKYNSNKSTSFLHAARSCSVICFIITIEITDHHNNHLIISSRSFLLRASFIFKTERHSRRTARYRQDNRRWRRICPFWRLT